MLHLSTQSPGARGPGVTGVDIDSSELVAATAVIDEAGAVRVTRAISVPLPASCVRDGVIEDAVVVSEALVKIWERERLPRKVRLAVGGSHVVMRAFDVPAPARKRDLAVAIRETAAEHIPHLDLEQAAFGYQQVGEHQVDGHRRIEVVAVATREDQMMTLVNAVRAARLRPIAVELSAFAMLRGLGGVPTQPTLICYLGGQVTMAIVRDGRVALTRTVKTGLDALASAGEESLLAPTETFAGQGDAVASMVGERIADEAQATMGYQAGDGDQPLERIVLGGPGAARQELVQPLARRLRLPLDVAIPAPLDDAALDGIAAERTTIAAGLAVGAL